MIKRRGKLRRGLALLAAVGPSVGALARGLWQGRKRWMLPLAVFLCATGLILLFAFSVRRPSLPSSTRSSEDMDDPADRDGAALLLRGALSELRRARHARDPAPAGRAEPARASARRSDRRRRPRARSRVRDRADDDLPGERQTLGRGRGPHARGAGAGGGVRRPAGSAWNRRSSSRPTCDARVWPRGDLTWSFSLGVLHHTPDPARGLRRPGALGATRRRRSWSASTTRSPGCRTGCAACWRARRGCVSVPWDPVLRDRQAEPARRAGDGCDDQYLHPEEHRHTLGEVQAWFRANQVEYLRSLSKRAPQRRGALLDDDLFAQAEDDWWPEGILAQLGWMRNLGMPRAAFSWSLADGLGVPEAVAPFASWARLGPMSSTTKPKNSSSEKGFRRNAENAGRSSPAGSATRRRAELARMTGVAFQERAGAYGAQQGLAVHDRHHEVRGTTKVGALLEHHLERLLAVGGAPDRISLQLEKLLESLGSARTRRRRGVIFSSPSASLAR